MCLVCHVCRLYHVLLSPSFARTCGALIHQLIYMTIKHHIVHPGWLQTIICSMHVHAYATLHLAYHCNATLNIEIEWTLYCVCRCPHAASYGRISRQRNNFVFGSDTYGHLQWCLQTEKTQRGSQSQTSQQRRKCLLVIMKNRVCTNFFINNMNIMYLFRQNICVCIEYERQTQNHAYTFYTTKYNETKSFCSSSESPSSMCSIVPILAITC